MSETDLAIFSLLLGIAKQTQTEIGKYFWLHTHTYMSAYAYAAMNFMYIVYTYISFSGL